MRHLLIVLSLLAAPAAVAAQPATQNVEVEPVTCWWRTGVSSVRVGQPFTVILTCSALETEAAKAVIDRGRLAPAAVQVPPYEVTGGGQSDDVTTASRRFMQYEYTLRLLGDDVFGADVSVPPLQIPYRIESKVQQDGAVQGREQIYVLPPLPVHVASLVPATETHIREAPVTTLAGIAARQSRGALMRTTGTIAFALAGLLLLVSVGRSVQQRRSAVAQVRTHILGDAAILAGVRDHLRAVQQEAAREGWSEALAARALAALRVTASYAAGQPVAQLRAGDGAQREGQIAIRRTLGSSVFVSGAATALSVPPSDSSTETDLREALTALTAARYGRASSGADVSEAVAGGIRATARVASAHTWFAQWAGGIRRAVDRRRRQVWER